jgi:hypothetical protein
MFDADNANGVAYSRLAGDRVLTFESAADDQPRDLETGTVWNLFEGEAIEGPLAGEKLDRLKSSIIFWFAWKDFHPDTAVYEADA